MANPSFPWLPGTTPVYLSPFKHNIIAFLKEYGDLVPLKLQLTTAWIVPLKHKNGVVKLHVYEEHLDESSGTPPICDQCRNMGWQHHPVSNCRFHFILPSPAVLSDPDQLPSLVEAAAAGHVDPAKAAVSNLSVEVYDNDPRDSTYNAPASIFDSTTHCLHGVIHGNGFGHLLRINGRDGAAATAAAMVAAQSEGGDSGMGTAAAAAATTSLSGPELMNLWDQLCSTLRAREVSVEDVSNKASMLLRLLYCAAHTRPWYGKWGYGFGRAAFNYGVEEYTTAVQAVHQAPVSGLLRDMEGVDATALKILRTYCTLPPNLPPEANFGQLLQRMLSYISRPDVLKEARVQHIAAMKAAMVAKAVVATGSPGLPGHDQPPGQDGGVEGGGSGSGAVSRKTPRGGKVVLPPAKRGRRSAGPEEPAGATESGPAGPSTLAGAQAPMAAVSGAAPVAGAMPAGPLPPLPPSAGPASAAAVASATAPMLVASTLLPAMASTQPVTGTQTAPSMPEYVSGLGNSVLSLNGLLGAGNVQTTCGSGSGQPTSMPSVPSLPALPAANSAASNALASSTMSGALAVRPPLATTPSSAMAAWSSVVAASAAAAAAAQRHSLAAAAAAAGPTASGQPHPPQSTALSTAAIAAAAAAAAMAAMAAQAAGNASGGPYRPFLRPGLQLPFLQSPFFRPQLQQLLPQPQKQQQQGAGGLLPQAQSVVSQLPAPRPLLGIQQHLQGSAQGQQQLVLHQSQQPLGQPQGQQSASQLQPLPLRSVPQQPQHLLMQPPTQAHAQQPQQQQQQLPVTRSSLHLQQGVPHASIEPSTVKPLTSAAPPGFMPTPRGVAPSPAHAGFPTPGQHVTQQQQSAPVSTSGPVAAGTQFPPGFVPMQNANAFQPPAGLLSQQALQQQQSQVPQPQQQQDQQSSAGALPGPSSLPTGFVPLGLPPAFTTSSSSMSMGTSSAISADSTGALKGAPLLLRPSHQQTQPQPQLLSPLMPPPSLSLQSSQALPTASAHQQQHQHVPGIRSLPPPQQQPIAFSSAQAQQQQEAALRQVDPSSLKPLSISTDALAALQHLTQLTKEESASQAPLPVSAAKQETPTVHQGAQDITDTAALPTAVELPPPAVQSEPQLRSAQQQHVPEQQQPQHTWFGQGLPSVWPRPPALPVPPLQGLAESLSQPQPLQQQQQPNQQGTNPNQLVPMGGTLASSLPPLCTLPPPTALQTIPPQPLQPLQQQVQAQQLQLQQQLQQLQHIQQLMLQTQALLAPLIRQASNAGCGAPNPNCGQGAADACSPLPQSSAAPGQPLPLPPVTSSQQQDAAPLGTLPTSTGLQQVLTQGSSGSTLLLAAPRLQHLVHPGSLQQGATGLQAAAPESQQESGRYGQDATALQGATGSQPGATDAGELFPLLQPTAALQVNCSGPGEPLPVPPGLQTDGTQMSVADRQQAAPDSSAQLELPEQTLRNMKLPALHNQMQPLHKAQCDVHPVAIAEHPPVPLAPNVLAEGKGTAAVATTAATGSTMPMTDGDAPPAPPEIWMHASSSLPQEQGQQQPPQPLAYPWFPGLVSLPSSVSGIPATTSMHTDAGLAQAHPDLPALQQSQQLDSDINSRPTCLASGGTVQGNTSDAAGGHAEAGGVGTAVSPSTSIPTLTLAPHPPSYTENGVHVSGLPGGWDIAWLPTGASASTAPFHLGANLPGCSSSLLSGNAPAAAAEVEAVAASAATASKGTLEGSSSSALDSTGAPNALGKGQSPSPLNLVLPGPGPSAPVPDGTAVAQEAVGTGTEGGWDEGVGDGATLLSFGPEEALGGLDPSARNSGIEVVPCVGGSAAELGVQEASQRAAGAEVMEESVAVLERNSKRQRQNSPEEDSQQLAQLMSGGNFGLDGGESGPWSPSSIANPQIANRVGVATAYGDAAAAEQIAAGTVGAMDVMSAAQHAVYDAAAASLPSLGPAQVRMLHPPVPTRQDDPFGPSATTCNDVASCGGSLPTAVTSAVAEESQAPLGHSDICAVPAEAGPAAAAGLMERLDSGNELRQIDLATPSPPLTHPPPTSAEHQAQKPVSKVESWGLQLRSVGEPTGTVSPMELDPSCPLSGVLGSGAVASVAAAVNPPDALRSMDGAREVAGMAASGDGPPDDASGQLMRPIGIAVSVLPCQPEAITAVDTAVAGRAPAEQAVADLAVEGQANVDPVITGQESEGNERLLPPTPRVSPPMDVDVDVDLLLPDPHEGMQVPAAAAMSPGAIAPPNPEEVETATDVDATVSTPVAATVDCGVDCMDASPVLGPVSCVRQVGGSERKDGGAAAMVVEEVIEVAAQEVAESMGQGMAVTPMTMDAPEVILKPALAQLPSAQSQIGELPLDVQVWSPSSVVVRDETGPQLPSATGASTVVDPRRSQARDAADVRDGAGTNSPASTLTMAVACSVGIAAATSAGAPSVVDMESEVLIEGRSIVVVAPGCVGMRPRTDMQSLASATATTDGGGTDGGGAAAPLNITAAVLPQLASDSHGGIVDGAAAPDATKASGARPIEYAASSPSESLQGTAVFTIAAMTNSAAEAPLPDLWTDGAAAAMKADQWVGDQVGVSMERQVSPGARSGAATGITGAFNTPAPNGADGDAVEGIWKDLPPLLASTTGFTDTPGCDVAAAAANSSKQGGRGRDGAGPSAAPPLPAAGLVQDGPATAPKYDNLCMLYGSVGEVPLIGMVPGATECGNGAVGCAMAASDAAGGPHGSGVRAAVGAAAASPGCLGDYAWGLYDGLGGADLGGAGDTSPSGWSGLDLEDLEPGALSLPPLPLPPELRTRAYAVADTHTVITGGGDDAAPHTDVAAAGAVAVAAGDDGNGDGGASGPERTCCDAPAPTTSVASDSAAALDVDAADADTSAASAGTAAAAGMAAHDDGDGINLSTDLDAEGGPEDNLLGGAGSGAGATSAGCGPGGPSGSGSGSGSGSAGGNRGRNSLKASGAHIAPAPEDLAREPIASLRELHAEPEADMHLRDCQRSMDAMLQALQSHCCYQWLARLQLRDVMMETYRDFKVLDWVLKQVANVRIGGYVVYRSKYTVTRSYYYRLERLPDTPPDASLSYTVPMPVHGPYARKGNRLIKPRGSATLNHLDIAAAPAAAAGADDGALTTPPPSPPLPPSEPTGLGEAPVHGAAMEGDIAGSAKRRPESTTAVAAATGGEPALQTAIPDADVPPADQTPKGEAAAAGRTDANTLNAGIVGTDDESRHLDVVIMLPCPSCCEATDPYEEWRPQAPAQADSPGGELVSLPPMLAAAQEEPGRKAEADVAIEPRPGSGADASGSQAAQCGPVPSARTVRIEVLDSEVPADEQAQADDERRRSGVAAGPSDTGGSNSGSKGSPVRKVMCKLKAKAPPKTHKVPGLGPVRLPVKLRSKALATAVPGVQAEILAAEALCDKPDKQAGGGDGSTDVAAAAGSLAAPPDNPNPVAGSTTSGGSSRPPAASWRDMAKEHQSEGQALLDSVLESRIEQRAVAGGRTGTGRVPRELRYLMSQSTLSKLKQQEQQQQQEQGQEWVQMEEQQEQVWVKEASSGGTAGAQSRCKAKVVPGRAKPASQTVTPGGRGAEQQSQQPDLSGKGDETLVGQKDAVEDADATCPLDSRPPEPPSHVAAAGETPAASTVRPASLGKVLVGEDDELQRQPTASVSGATSGSRAKALAAGPENKAAAAELPKVEADLKKEAMPGSWLEGSNAELRADASKSFPPENFATTAGKDAKYGNTVMPEATVKLGMFEDDVDVCAMKRAPTGLPTLVVPVIKEEVTEVKGEGPDSAGTICPKAIEDNLMQVPAATTPSALLPSQQQMTGQRPQRMRIASKAAQEAAEAEAQRRRKSASKPKADELAAATGPTGSEDKASSAAIPAGLSFPRKPRSLRTRSRPSSVAMAAASAMVAAMLDAAAAVPAKTPTTSGLRSPSGVPVTNTTAVSTVKSTTRRSGGAAGIDGAACPEAATTGTASKVAPKADAALGQVKAVTGTTKLKGTLGKASPAGPVGAAPASGGVKVTASSKSSSTGNARATSAGAAQKAALETKSKPKQPPAVAAAPPKATAGAPTAPSEAKDGPPGLAGGLGPSPGQAAALRRTRSTAPTLAVVSPPPPPLQQQQLPPSCPDKSPAAASSSSPPGAPSSPAAPNGSLRIRLGKVTRPAALAQPRGGGGPAPALPPTTTAAVAAAAVAAAAAPASVPLPQAARTDSGAAMAVGTAAPSREGDDGTAPTLVAGAVRTQMGCRRNGMERAATNVSTAGASAAVAATQGPAPSEVAGAKRKRFKPAQSESHSLSRSHSQANSPSRSQRRLKDGTTQPLQNGKRQKVTHSATVTTAATTGMATTAAVSSHTAAGPSRGVGGTSTAPGATVSTAAGGCRVIAPTATATAGAATEACGQQDTACSPVTAAAANASASPDCTGADPAGSASAPASDPATVTAPKGAKKRAPPLVRGAAASGATPWTSATGTKPMLAVCANDSGKGELVGVDNGGGGGTLQPRVPNSSPAAGESSTALLTNEPTSNLAIRDAAACSDAIPEEGSVALRTPMAAVPVAAIVHSPTQQEATVASAPESTVPSHSPPAAQADADMEAAPPDPPAEESHITPSPAAAASTALITALGPVASQRPYEVLLRALPLTYIHKVKVAAASGGPLPEPSSTGGGGRRGRPGCLASWVMSVGGGGSGGGSGTSFDPEPPPPTNPYVVPGKAHHNTSLTYINDQTQCDIQYMYCSILRLYKPALAVAAALTSKRLAGLKPLALPYMAAAVQMLKDTRYFVKDYGGGTAAAAAAASAADGKVRILVALQLDEEQPAPQHQGPSRRSGTARASAAAAAAAAAASVAATAAHAPPPRVPRQMTLTPPEVVLIEPSSPSAAADGSAVAAVTLGDLKRATAAAFKETYRMCCPRNGGGMVVTTIVRGIDAQVLADGDSAVLGPPFTTAVDADAASPRTSPGGAAGSPPPLELPLVVVRCSGLDLDRRWRHAGGPEDWRVACLCGTQDDDGERMIACDVCGVWSHTRCNDIPDEMEEPPSFVCRSCTRRGLAGVSTAGGGGSGGK